MNDTEIVEHLKAAAVPPGPRYVAVYRLLVVAPGRSWTAEEIYAGLLPDDCRINFIGIKRIIQRLFRAGILCCQAQKGRQGRDRTVFILALPVQAANTQKM